MKSCVEWHFEQLWQEYRRSQGDESIAVMIHGRLANGLVKHLMKIHREIGQPVVPIARLKLNE
ncbi:MAG: hypothetical protein P3X23_004590 [Thermosynechococcus sp. Uc]|uniref:hypothetical protein n=1 Tax=Thermosynechococcus sp. Uc TaxID=3034853 RepID=UPI00259F766F|nr:hypothetical protein [Thermosynechococcus sp. Uc]MDM7326382.1 hypothetical protein [Thermosynechococcus sp. Uc]